jgi:hypothetical protein
VAYLIGLCVVFVAYLRRICGVSGAYLWRIRGVSERWYQLSRENAQACSNMAPYRFLSAVRAYGRCERREVLGSEYVRCVGVRYLFVFAFCVFDSCVVRAYGFFSLGSRHISGFRVLIVGRP